MNAISLSEVYALSSASVVASSQGGFIGVLLFSSPPLPTSINNVYTRANVTCVGAGIYCSPFVAVFLYSSNFTANMSFSNVYVSSSSSCSLSCYLKLYGLPNEVSYSQFYFDKSLTYSVLSPNSTDGTFVEGFNCSQLYDRVYYNFSQSIWGGDRLRSEFNYSYGFCSCSSCPALVTVIQSTLSGTTEFPTTNLPTTFYPTTRLPTTNFPTTELPTTMVGTTEFPTTNLPTTFYPTTRLPTTNFPTTELPTTMVETTEFSTTNLPTIFYRTTSFPTTELSTTQSATTYLQMTNLATTQVATSEKPSTLSPVSQTTNAPSVTTSPTSSLVSSTLISSNPTISSTTNTMTMQETTHSPICFYIVPNCEFCSHNPPLFDLTKGNVSCVFSSQQQVWRWIFTPNNGTLTNNGEIVVSGNTTTLVEGNFNNNGNFTIVGNSSIFISGNLTQTSGGQIVFTFNPSSSQNNNKTSGLNVGGCVSINGNISLNLETQPQQGTTNLQVISYNQPQHIYK